MHSAIYPVASLHLTPTRFVADPAISRNPRPGCRHRQPPCRPGPSRYGPLRRRQSPPPAMPSQPRWSPPDPQQPGPCPAGTPPTTTPTVDRGWLRRHRPRAVAVVASWRQPTAPAAALPPGPKRTVLAGPTTGQCQFAVPYGRPGQLRPGPGVRFPQFRNARSGHWFTPRSLFLPKSDDILTNPSD